MERRRPPSKADTYAFGTKGRKFGVWDVRRMCWCFGIQEDTPMLAEARLLHRLGSAFDRDRYSFKELPADMVEAGPSGRDDGELRRKDAEIRMLRKRIMELERRLGGSSSDDQQAEIEFTRD